MSVDILHRPGDHIGDPCRTSSQSQGTSRLPPTFLPVARARSPNDRSVSQGDEGVLAPGQGSLNGRQCPSSHRDMVLNNVTEQGNVHGAEVRSVVSHTLEKEEGEIEDTEQRSRHMSIEDGQISSRPVSSAANTSTLPKFSQELVDKCREVIGVVLREDIRRKLGVVTLGNDHLEKVSKALTDDRCHDFIRFASRVQEELAERAQQQSQVAVVRLAKRTREQMDNTESGDDSTPSDPHPGPKQHTFPEKRLREHMDGSHILDRPSHIVNSHPPTESRSGKRERESETQWSDEHGRFKRARTHSGESDAASSNGTADSKRSSQATLIEDEAQNITSRREKAPDLHASHLSVSDADETNTFLESLARSLHAQDPRPQSRTMDTRSRSISLPHQDGETCTNHNPTTLRARSHEDYQTDSRHPNTRPPTSSPSIGARSEVPSAAPRDAGMAIPSKPTLVTTPPHSETTAMGYPAWTRDVDPTIQSTQPPPFTSRVPGLWYAWPGEACGDVLESFFEVDADTAAAIRRWVARLDDFNSSFRHVAVYLLCLPIAEVTALNERVASGEVVAPDAIARAMKDIPTSWPKPGYLTVQLNREKPNAQTWFAPEFRPNEPLDISSAVQIGVNALHIIQLTDMSNYVFAVYAAPPTQEELAQAQDWQEQKKVFSSSLLTLQG